MFRNMSRLLKTNQAPALVRNMSGAHGGDKYVTHLNELRNDFQRSFELSVSISNMQVVTLCGRRDSSSEPFPWSSWAMWTPSWWLMVGCLFVCLHFLCRVWAQPPGVRALRPPPHQEQGDLGDNFDVELYRGFLHWNILNYFLFLRLEQGLIIDFILSAV